MTNLSIAYDSSELDDVDLEALIEAKRQRERDRAEIGALRDELARTEAAIARAIRTGDNPYSEDAGSPYNDVPPGVERWSRRPPSGNDLRPSFEDTRARILDRLEQLGEAVE